MTEHAAFPDAMRAILDGREDDLRALLAEHPDLARARAEEDTRGMQNTLLHVTTGMGEVTWPENAAALARLLVEAGAEVDACEREAGGETPLHHAVSVNNAEVAAVLLEAGADPEREGRYRSGLDTPLGYALFYGTDKRLPRFAENCPELLVRHGAAVTLPFAAGLGREDLLSARLAEGGDGPEWRLTLQHALLFACHQGHTSLVAPLVAAGARPNECVPFFHWNCAGMHTAAIHGQRDAVSALLAAGASPVVTDGIHRSTPLEWAEMGQEDEIVELLENARRSRIRR